MHPFDAEEQRLYSEPPLTKCPDTLQRKLWRVLVSTVRDDG